MTPPNERPRGLGRGLSALIGDEVSRRDPERHLAKLQSVAEKIAQLEKQLPSPVDPQLAHFLARCSYDKALALLEE